MDEPAVGFTPDAGAGGGGRAEFDFPNTFENGLPEISQWRKVLAPSPIYSAFPRRRLIRRACRFHPCTRRSCRAGRQAEKAFFPCFLADFDIDPFVGAALEEFGSDAVGFSPGFFRTTRNGFHHAAIAAATDGKTALRKSFAQSESFVVIGIAGFRARAAEHGYDFSSTVGLPGFCSRSLLHDFFLFVKLSSLQHSPSRAS